MQGLKDQCTIRYKSVVKIHQTQKLPQFALSGWEWELTNGLYLDLKGADAMLVHMETQEVK